MVVLVSVFTVRTSLSTGGWCNIEAPVSTQDTSFKGGFSIEYFQLK